MVMAIVTTMVAIQNQALVVAVKRALIEFNIHKSNKAVSGLKSGTVFSFYENGQIDFWHFSAKIGVSMKKGTFMNETEWLNYFETINNCKLTEEEIQQSKVNGEFIASEPVADNSQSQVQVSEPVTE